ncbi:hypothetical protein B0H63DRAFT_131815 [Podospora didyma]|uniref:Uncharacterized protein n=1 Tax=Podospora didyma TaxID=330526 RepID=A0AAE0P114_9PEZI|nr:hypothetical protein B0H63DRAFT_131815 [Podospora didyma]
MLLHVALACLGLVPFTAYLRPASQGATLDLVKRSITTNCAPAPHQIKGLMQLSRARRLAQTIKGQCAGRTSMIRHDTAAAFYLAGAMGERLSDRIFVPLGRDGGRMERENWRSMSFL